MELHGDAYKFNKRWRINVSNMLHNLLFLACDDGVASISSCIFLCCNLSVFITSVVFGSDVFWKVSNGGYSLPLRDLVHVLWYRWIWVRFNHAYLFYSLILIINIY